MGKPPTPEDPQRAAARNRLLTAIADLEDNGLSTPCRQPDIRDWWTSDLADELEAAAHRCGPCPVLARCRSFGIAWPAEVGVYGGLTQKQRRTAARTTNGAA